VGYRDTWLMHAGGVTRHAEVVLHAFDREFPTESVRVLDVGVENGGSLEVWKSCLPDGSTVLGMDSDPIVDSTGEMSPWTWAFLRPGGRLIFEDYERLDLMGLVDAVAADGESWLPVEEIMRVTVFPRVAVVEKRYPRVIPYADVMVGNFADVTGERALTESGTRWVLVD